ncbi:MAG: CRISPR locus-related DNA-binding protein [Alphaproteobacteria bacterium]|nr:MAG: CRISPR locus-related DNA-binding protein [Alphaproteobacteria bacterium]
MKTYISLLGFETSQFFSLIVKYGIEKDDRIILIRPQNETDERGQKSVREVEDIAKKIDGSIKVEIHKVNHLNFNEMLLSIIDLFESVKTEIIANISGGPRDILLAFSIACLTQTGKISKVTNRSDIDHELREIQLPHIVSSLDEKLNILLEDIINHEPTIASEIADRLQISESTVSRNINKLKELKAIDVEHQGKIKYISATTTGKIFLKIRS